MPAKPTGGKPKVPDALYLKPEEVAKILRVDRRTVYTWLRARKFPGARQFGSAWRIPRSVVIPEDQGEK